MSEEIMAFRQEQDKINLDMKSLEGEMGRLREKAKTRFGLSKDEKNKLTNLERKAYKLRETNFDLLAGK